MFIILQYPSTASNQFFIKSPGIVKVVSIKTDQPVDHGKNDQGGFSCRHGTNGTIFLADPIYNEYYRQIRQVETEQDSLKTQENRLLSNIDLYEEKLKSMPEIEKSFAAIQRKIDLHGQLQVDLFTGFVHAQMQACFGERDLILIRVSLCSRAEPSVPKATDFEISPIRHQGVLLGCAISCPNIVIIGRVVIQAAGRKRWSGVFFRAQSAW